MLTVPFFLIFIIIVFFEFFREKNIRYDCTFFLNVYYLICYSIVPLCIIIFGDAYIDNKLLRSTIYFKSPIIGFYCLFGYISYITGYYLSNKYTFSERNILFKVKLTELQMFYLLLLTMIFVILMVIIYSSQFGGVFNAIALAKDIRNGEYLGYNLSFVKRFFSLTLVVLYFSFSFSLNSANSLIRTKFRVMFILSVILVILIGLLNASRGFIIISFLGLYFIRALQQNKLYIKKLLIGILLALTFIFIGNPILLSIPALIESGWSAFLDSVDYYLGFMSSSVFEEVLSNFSHPVMSIGVAHESIYSGEMTLRLFSDYLWGALSIIPNFILTLDIPDTIAFYNTYNHLGEFESVIPPGMIAFGIYSLGLPGVFIYAFVIGFISKKVNYFMRDHLNSSLNSAVFIYLFSYYSGLLVFNSEPRVMIQSMFSSIIVLFFTLFLSKAYIKK
ncbi:hypothetical protein BCU72_15025 [Vibrio cyclitrophicus]|uniref:O-antigen polymerase n=1 Tax=Vibrio cyclitrophicus TaxID=47951 RepID=UPI00030C433C|nr:O-antigen polymerase [Vibrio cyclitrophicus]OEF32100.1 hypothetical protein OA7_16320 [Vibrio cyclitrophicus 1F53]PMH33112.1 hypothetical protein BCU72_15025 [Vibrio cyclitrophicus]